MKIINLLPKNRQVELEYERIFRSLLKYIWASILTFVLVLGGQYLVKVYSKKQITMVQGDIDNLKGLVSKKENFEIKKEIKAINDLIGDFKNLGQGSAKWTKVLKAFSQVPPDNVTIKSLDIDFATKTLRVTGNSPDRETVIEFYNRILATSENFGISEYPLENIARANDINFHFTLSIKDTLLK